MPCSAVLPAQVKSYTSTYTEESCSLTSPENGMYLLWFNSVSSVSIWFILCAEDRRSTRVSPKIWQLLGLNITKTWLKETVADSAVSTPGYTIIRKDMTTNNYGGVCLYVRDRCFKYHRLEELCCCTGDEILWVHPRPAARLPRGFSCLIAVWYHSPGADINIHEHLFNCLAAAKPNCTLIIAGDFNRLDVTRLKRHFYLKQIVKAPIRKDAILDLLLTNLHNHYDTPPTLWPIWSQYYFCRTSG